MTQEASNNNYSLAIDFDNLESINNALRESSYCFLNGCRSLNFYKDINKNPLDLHMLQSDMNEVAFDALLLLRTAKSLLVDEKTKKREMESDNPLTLSRLKDGFVKKVNSWNQLSEKLESECKKSKIS